MTTFHRGLQATERRHATGTQRAQFAVEIGRLHWHGAKGFDGVPIALGPVEASAGQELDLPRIQPGVHAIAVVLDFVQPIVARRDLVHGTRELRLDPRRRLGFLPHGDYSNLPSPHCKDACGSEWPPAVQQRTAEEDHAGSRAN